MSIRTIIFDFGNVLGSFSHRRSAEQVAAFGPLSVEAVQAYLYGGQLEHDYEAGRLSTPVFLGMLRQTCRLSCSDEELAHAFADMFTPNDEVCALVPLLKPCYRLVLLSNTNDLHYRQFRAQFAATLAHFDALVLSHEVGLRKPDPRLFAHCQGVAGCPAEQILFLDDLPSNVEAARACGWQGIVYHKGDDLRQRLLRAGVVVSPVNECEPGKVARWA
jgi:putative hydrolase of the HAD superfamily